MRPPPGKRCRPMSLVAADLTLRQEPQAPLRHGRAETIATRVAGGGASSPSGQRSCRVRGGVVINPKLSAECSPWVLPNEAEGACMGKVDKAERGCTMHEPSRQSAECHAKCTWGTRGRHARQRKERFARQTCSKTTKINLRVSGVWLYLCFFVALRSQC